MLLGLSQGFGKFSELWTELISTNFAVLIFSMKELISRGPYTTNVEGLLSSSFYFDWLFFSNHSSSYFRIFFFFNLLVATIFSYTCLKSKVKKKNLTFSWKDKHHRTVTQLTLSSQGMLNMVWYFIIYSLFSHQC